jgi:hypothetical protein
LTCLLMWRIFAIRSSRAPLIAWCWLAGAFSSPPSLTLSDQVAGRRAFSSASAARQSLVACSRMMSSSVSLPISKPSSPDHREIQGAGLPGGQSRWLRIVLPLPPTHVLPQALEKSQSFAVQGAFVSGEPALLGRFALGERRAEINRVARGFGANSGRRPDHLFRPSRTVQTGW